MNRRVTIIIIFSFLVFFFTFRTIQKEHNHFFTRPSILNFREFVCRILNTNILYLRPAYLLFVSDLHPKKKGSGIIKNI